MAGHTRDFLRSLPELLAVDGNGIVAGKDKESDDNDLSAVLAGNQKQDEDTPEQHQEPEPDLEEVLSELAGSLTLTQHNDDAAGCAGFNSCSPSRPGTWNPAVHNDSKPFQHSAGW